MWTRCSSLTLALLIVAALIPTVSLAATPPEQINYQGVLRDSADAPLDGEYDIVFRFFNDAERGDEILIDSHLKANEQAVTVADGLFSVALGSGDLADGSGPGLYYTLGKVFRDYTDLWLEVEVDSETLAPRVKILAAGYALNAGSLDGRSSASFIDTSSSAQAKSGKLIAGTTTGTGLAVGVEGYGADAGGRFEDADGSGLAWVGYGETGISAEGATQGGHFVDSTSTGWARVAYGDYGISASGGDAGGDFDNTDGSASAKLALHDDYWGFGYGVRANGNRCGGSFSDNDQSGVANVGFGDKGIYGEGDEAGGHFADGDGSGYAYVGYGEVGIYGSGNTAGGQFADNNHSGYAYVGYGEVGIYSSGNTAGGHFVDNNHTGYAYVGYGNSGMRAYGDDQGVFGEDLTSGTYGRLGYGSSSTAGNGTKNFVQNHPEDRERVIVYSALEGDEAGTYTRGTAHLSGGVAVVPLGETFRYVTNPDLGMTAHLTPVGAWADLYVESKSTTELVVRCRDCSEDLVFDYIVFGLRVGFEELPVVRIKDEPAYLPNFETELAAFESYPELQQTSPLARFRADALRAGLEPSESLDGARALVAAIGRFDPAVRLHPGRTSTRSAEDGLRPAELARDAPASERAEPSVIESATPVQTPSRPIATVPAPPLPMDQPVGVLLPLSEPVAPGDLLALDPTKPGALRLAREMADPAVLAVVVESAGSSEHGLQARVVLAGLAQCKADAGYGEIRPGDLLTASPTPGHAMRTLEPLVPGTIVGKAIEPLETGTGMIRIVVMPR